MYLKVREKERLNGKDEPENHSFLNLSSIHK
jgi:hypothetical protein